MTTTSNRADPRPEQVAFQDEGCSISPTCLNCPLPVCRYDMGKQFTHLTALVRLEAIRRDHFQLGLDAAALMRKYRVSPRTVARATSPKFAVDLPAPQVHDVHDSFKPSWGLSPIRYTA